MVSIWFEMAMVLTSAWTCTANQDIIEEAKVLKLNLTALEVNITLYPDVYELSKASNAIDGNTEIGKSGVTGFENCATTSIKYTYNELKYLKIDFIKPYYISAIRLHLRDGPFRQAWQRGLSVELVNSSTSVSGMQCGDPYVYNGANHGQSPIFHCFNMASGILLVLRQKPNPLQICEIEVFGGYCTASAPRNGYFVLPSDISTSFVPLQTWIEYRCHQWSGYLISSNYSRIQCIGQEKWSKPVPACSLADCGVPQNLDHGQCTVTGTTYGHKKKCSCNCGYRLRNRDFSTTTCHIKNSRADWSDPKPSCRQIMCEDLKNTRLQNGHVLADGRLFGATTEYTCDEGYELIGTKRRKCQENEEWSGAKPTCILKTCDTLSVPVHGYLSPPDFNRTSDSIVHYVCYAGYELMNGSSSRKCLQSYQWSGKQPSCQKFNCSMCHEEAECFEDLFCYCKPGYVGNGKYCCPEDLGGQMTLVGATAVFRCDKTCNVTSLNVTWYKNGQQLTSSEQKYGLENNRNVLFLENLTAADTDQYICQVETDTTSFRRYGILEVVDIQTYYPHSSSYSLDCGKSCVVKMLSSDMVLPGQFPWQAMLCSSDMGHYCGGALVSSDCVVTAAHCIVRQGTRRTNIDICLGHRCGNCSKSVSSQCLKSQYTIVHPQFSENTMDNDIAVIKLNQPVSLHCARALPVCLPDPRRDGQHIRPYTNGLVTGWKRKHLIGDRATCLRKGHVRLASNRLCNVRQPRYTVTNRMLCATGDNGACDKNSGGPMVINNRQNGGGDRYILAGIVSWGIGCDETNKLSVYTSVLSHVGWIKRSCGIPN